MASKINELTIVFKFRIFQKVKITELNLIGTIMSINIDSTSTEYKVRYFDNAKPELIYFLDTELEAI